MLGGFELAEGIFRTRKLGGVFESSIELSGVYLRTSVAGLHAASNV